LLAALLLAGLQGFGIGGIGFLAQIAQVLLGGVVGLVPAGRIGLGDVFFGGLGGTAAKQGQAAQEAESGNIVLHLL
jgi:hypothetical protein